MADCISQPRRSYPTRCSAHSGKLESKRYSVPPIKCRPVRNLAAASQTQVVSIRSEETAWLDSRSGLLLHNPRHASAVHRIHLGKLPECEVDEAILLQANRIAS